MNPFLTLLTPSRWDRQQNRSACIAHVEHACQGVPIQHLVEVDYVCDGIGAMFARLPQFAGAVRGEYVHVLADDDRLQPGAVQQVQDLARTWGYPPVIIVRVCKGALALPLETHGPPIEGRIDLGCIVTRADVWKAHCQQYGTRYEGDYDFANALWSAGHKFHYAPEVFFLRGAVMRGRAE